MAALPFVVVMLLLCFALDQATCGADPLSLRRRLADSVVRRAIRTGVDEYGHQKFTLVTQESTDPPTDQIQAVDATAAGQPIYARVKGRENGQVRKKGAARP